MIPSLRSRPHARHTATQHATSGAASQRRAGGWAALLVPLALAMLACGGESVPIVHSSNTSNPTTTATRTSGTGTTPADATSTPAHGPAPTPTHRPAPTPTHTPVPPPTPVPFTVSGVSVAASPASFNGLCASTMEAAFTATITVPAHTHGGTVIYAWSYSNGASDPPETLQFNAGDTSHTVSSTNILVSAKYGNGSTVAWAYVTISSPIYMLSGQGNFTLTCQIHATGVSVTVSPTTYTCIDFAETFNFSATITVSPSPGGTITFESLRSDGSHTSQTVSVTPGTTSATIFTSWQLSRAAPNLTYWEQVIVSSPNSVSSNKATFTKSC